MMPALWHIGLVIRGRLAAALLGIRRVGADFLLLAGALFSCASCSLRGISRGVTSVLGSRCVDVSSIVDGIGETDLLLDALL